MSIAQADMKNVGVIRKEKLRRPERDQIRQIRTCAHREARLDVRGEMVMQLPPRGAWEPICSTSSGGPTGADHGNEADDGGGGDEDNDEERTSP